jgi:hypothetical protein
VDVFGGGVLEADSAALDGDDGDDDDDGNDDDAAVGADSKTGM